MDIKSNKFFLIICLIAIQWQFNIFFSQAKTPTIMILPSDNWCQQRYFMTNYSNQGINQKVPNYKKAFQEDTELPQVISKIGELMTDRGFELIDAEQEIKAIEARTAEDNMTRSKSNSEFNQTPLQILKNKAKADILIQIWWNVTKTKKGNIISFDLKAFDAYTSVQIGSSSGHSTKGKEIVPILVEKAILKNIDPFVKQLKQHFVDILKNGREIRLTIRTWENWKYDLESEFNDEELRYIIYSWVENHSKGTFNQRNSSEYRSEYEKLRIPIYDDKGSALDAEQYARKLVKFLKKEPFNFICKIIPRGLGEAIIILGEK